MKRSKYISGSTVASSFLGMMMAVPFAFALGSSPANNTAAAQSGQTSTAQVSTADFAKFAYAYNQGYEARVASASATSTDMTTCSEASVTTGGSGGASAEVVPAKAVKSGGGQHQGKLAAMVNSYNSYTSMIYNSSSVTNTNSNNNVGSNNSTSTSIKVGESKGMLMIGVSNDPQATQIATNDSFNKDSYNTKTDTTIVNDSFNKETNVAINSGNTSTETTTVNKTDIDDSYNTKNIDVTKDSNNTMSNEMNVTNNETKTIDSNNTTTIDADVDVDISSQQGGPAPLQNV